MKAHGWLGAAILVGAETLLYLGNRFAATWFTPLMWTGYILLLDAAVAQRSGQSWLTTRRKEFPFLVVLSVLSWLLFEIYNFKLKNWQYVGLPTAMGARDIGFFWSFATITPALFQTAEFIEAMSRPKPSPHGRRFEPGSLQSAIAITVGLAFVAIPPLLPDSLAPYAFGFVWLGFIPLLEPLLLRLGQPSLLRDGLNGNPNRVWKWLGAGLACGLLWELWNHQALRVGGAGWLYTMPDLIHDLIFGLHYGKMPLIGLLGFPPFAWECFAIYHFLRWALQLDRLLPGDMVPRKQKSRPPGRLAADPAQVRAEIRRWP